MVARPARCGQRTVAQLARLVAPAREGERPAQRRLHVELGGRVGGQRQRAAQQLLGDAAVQGRPPVGVVVGQRRRHHERRLVGGLGDRAALEAALERRGHVAGAHVGVGELEQQLAATAAAVHQREHRLEVAGGVVERHRGGGLGRGPAGHLDRLVRPDEGHGLGEVVGDLADRPLPDALEGPPEVEVGAPAGRGAQVVDHRAPHEHVREAVLAGARLVDQARADGGVERAEHVALRGPQGVGHHRDRERGAGDRRRLQHPAGLLGQARHADRDHLADALGAGHVVERPRRSPRAAALDDVPGVDQVPPQLTHEEGVAVGLGGEQVGDRLERGVALAAADRVHEVADLPAVERAEPDAHDAGLAAQVR